MIKMEMFTKYDNDTRILTYYESLDKCEDHQALANLKLRTYYNSVIDFKKN